MSTSVAPHPKSPQATPPGTAGQPAGQSIPPSLRQREKGRDRDFGLDTARLRRVRLIVFALLSPLLILLALLAIRFVSMPITQAMHLDAYGSQNYPTAIERLWPVQRLNFFEPYLPHLSKGTALLQQGEDAAAEEELRTALAEWDAHEDLNAPLHAECKIRNNLAISIERQAEQIDDAAERADRLYEAEEIIAPCAGGGGGGDGEGGEGGEGGGEGEPQEGQGNEDSETTEDNGERVREKRREADEEAGNDPDARGTEQDKQEGEDPGEDPQQKDPGDPRREDDEGEGPQEEAPDEGDSEQKSKDDELEQRNRDAQNGDDGEDTGGSNTNPDKPW
ncbi:hypothetical protein [Brachybacterium sp. UMB0905]|uniref:hypothetical protein n=1 Tax=Brachybacterium sp. UMB0905 TaxID=2069310 RepID=UPI000C8074BD|nr:hypothetical protein [Brachybacterium sp. UMB0905]PMC76643.1 hypothetical protein CJ197_02625 [Brachybacterium sp. UMB0905]